MVVGITGNMGAGKSTLARMLVDRGAQLVDADRIGHEVIETDAVRDQLTNVFGDGIVGPDGHIIRRELGRLAFADQASRNILNQIVHPPLVRKVWCRVQCHSESADSIVIVDAALLFEWGELERFDLTVVVRATADNSSVRATRRLGLSTREVQERLAHQLPIDEKALRADVLIDNDGDIGDLENQAEALWRQLVSAA